MTKPKYRIVPFKDVKHNQVFRHKGEWLYKSEPCCGYPNKKGIGKITILMDEDRVGVYYYVGNK